jgi:hypothetical protein
MEYPQFEKEINGHHMTIHFHGDEENITEALLWCRTCDPEAKNQVVRQTTVDTISTDVQGLMESATNHAEGN